MTNTNDSKNAYEDAQRIDKEYHYFTTILNPNESQSIMSSSNNSQGKLAGYAVTLKDAILVKGVETTASSAILQGYKPLFHATVVSKIIKEGGMIIGKTVHDEFGFGALNVNVSHGRSIPLNPHDKERACGGSSGGAAGFTAKATIPHIAIGESTGGSIVCPASFCGVVGLCPTYGRVSRYGLIDYSNSLDKIGPIAKTVREVALMLEVIAGKDEHDATSADVPVPAYSDAANKDIAGMRIGVIEDNFGDGVEEPVKNTVNNVIKGLKKRGAIVESVSLPITKAYALPVYYILGTAEASTNLAKYCGMRYGYMENPTNMSFNDYFTKIRSKQFNDETKRRIILGTFTRMAGTRDAYYIKSAQTRTLIIEEYKALFEKYDALISPTMPIIAPRFETIKKLTPLQHYQMDIFLVGPNVAGLPHITIPNGSHENMPIGTMLIANHFNEEVLITLGSAIETIEQRK